MKKRFTSMLLAIIMCMSLCVPAFAVSNEDDDSEIEVTSGDIEGGNGTVVPLYLGTNTTHSWTYSYGNPVEKTKGSWTHCYTGSPAKRDGEYDTVTHSVSYTSTFSGTFGGSIKSSIQVELGVSFSKSESFSISRNSGQLKKGEYIKAYWIKNYDSYDVKQVDYQHTYGFEQKYPYGPYEAVDRYNTVVSHVTVDKAIHPQIKIEYWKGGNKVSALGADGLMGAGGNLERTEYYEWINGEYQMVYGMNS